MQPVNIGVIGLGNVGSGTLDILAENAGQIAQKLGFPLRVAAVCSRGVAGKQIPAGLGSPLRTADWREVVNHPDIQIVAELIGGTTVAREIIEAAAAKGKSVVTANKELMATAGADLWEQAIATGTNLAMEASVAGGIPIHTVLREGISGDRVTNFYGILNGTCNYMLTRMEREKLSFEECLIRTVNLGGDADTTGALAGMIAGALYGVGEIPRPWLQRLDRKVVEEIKAQVPGLLALSAASGR